MADESIRSAHQIQAEGPNNEIRNVKVNARGELIVTGGTGGGTVSSNETTHLVIRQEIDTEAKTVDLGYKVTGMLLANLSEAATITVVAGGVNIPVPAGIAVDVPINKVLENISITTDEAGAPVYIVIKGEA